MGPSLGRTLSFTWLLLMGLRDLRPASYDFTLVRRLNIQLCHRSEKRRASCVRWKIPTVDKSTNETVRPECNWLYWERFEPFFSNYFYSYFIVVRVLYAVCKYKVYIAKGWMIPTIWYIIQIVRIVQTANWSRSGILLHREDRWVK